MTTVTTFDLGETVVKIATIEKVVENLFNVLPPENEIFGKSSS